ncbi:MAG: PDZ domain-containing protein [Candidatus Omnitrophica bacterium]|nr:PDZ domain-containing protein [Candidatus Omnitrophota bacterium]
MHCRRERSEAISFLRLPRRPAKGGTPRNDAKKSRLQATSSLLFLFFLFSGFSLSSSQSDGRAFPLPGNFEEVWKATLATLEAEKIPLAVTNKKEGYIQTATFPLYKDEYKRWAKAPMISSQGFCALEIGIVEKDSTMTVIGIKAYFKRKSSLSTRPLSSKTDKSRGVFEGLMGYRIHEKLVDAKYPKVKSVILGCDLHYEDKIAQYVIADVEEHQLAYEQGLRNGDILLKIDGRDVTPGNLFGFLMNIQGETLRNFTVFRDKEEVRIPVSIFYLNPDAPHLGFTAERDPKTLEFKITAVRPNSPAEHEGFLPGDILLKQNAVLLDSWRNYYRAALAQKEGEVQTFQLARRGKLLEKKIIPAAVQAPAGEKKVIPVAVQAPA